MAHYQYFVAPITALTNERLRQIPEIELFDEVQNLYRVSLGALKQLFKLKIELQGTGGRNSVQPIDFSVFRRLGDDAIPRQLAPSEIETLLREALKLKPAYPQRAQINNRFI